MTALLHPLMAAAYALHRRGLLWLQRDLRSQLAATQADLDEATARAVALSRLHRCDPALQELRRGLRAERDTLERRLKTVGADLAALDEGRMPKPRRPLPALLLALIGAAAAVLVACGGGGDNIEPDQPTPTVDCRAKPEQCK